MITIEKLNLCKGADRWGSCNSCSKSSKEAEIFRIKAETDLGQGINLCLCRGCANTLLGALDATLFNDQGVDDADCDSKSRLQGKWIEMYRNDFGKMICMCSKCSFHAPRSHYCPNCGAKNE